MATRREELPANLGIFVQDHGSDIGPTRTEQVGGVVARTVQDVPGSINFDKGFVNSLAGSVLTVQTEGRQQQVMSADGAITITAGKVIITKGSAAALTLAAPTAGADDGKELRIISTTAFAHTVTTPTNGINGAKHIATFAAAIGEILLTAYNGVWYASDNATTLS